MIPDERMAEIEKRWTCKSRAYGTGTITIYPEELVAGTSLPKDIRDLLTAHKELRAEKDATCTWTKTADGQYETGCGHVYEFEHCDPAENRQAYCGYCGKRIAVVAFEEDTP